MGSAVLGKESSLFTYSPRTHSPSRRDLLSQPRQCICFPGIWLRATESIDDAFQAPQEPAAGFAVEDVELHEPCFRAAKGSVGLLLEQFLHVLAWRVGSWVLLRHRFLPRRGCSHPRIGPDAHAESAGP